jgi:predicted exporter
MKAEMHGEAHAAGAETQSQARERTAVRVELRQRKRAAETALEEGGANLLEQLNDADSLGQSGTLPALRPVTV